MDLQTLQKQLQDLQYIVYNHRHRDFDKTKTLDINTKKVVSLTDTAIVDIDSSAGDIFFLSATGNRTLNAPTNPSTGKKIIIRFLASGGAHTLSLAGGVGGFRFGTDVTGMSSTSSGVMDYIGAIWNEVDSFWDVVAYSKGY